MDPKQIKEIVETIKTLNINFNAETTQKIADAIIPVVKMYLIKEYVDMALGFIISLAVIYGLYKIVALIIKNIEL